MSKPKLHFAKRVTHGVRMAINPNAPVAVQKTPAQHIIIQGKKKSEMINRAEFQKTPEERQRLKDAKANCENRLLSSDVNRRRRIKRK